MIKRIPWLLKNFSKYNPLPNTNLIPVFFFSDLKNKSPLSPKKTSPNKSPPKIQKQVSKSQIPPIHEAPPPKKQSPRPDIPSWRYLDNHNDFKHKVVPIANDIGKISALLSEICKVSIRKDTFEKQCFKNYTFLASEILHHLRSKNPKDLDLMSVLDLFHQTAVIFATLGQLESAKINLLRNKLCKILFDRLEELDPKLIYKLVEAMYHFQIKHWEYNRDLSKVMLNFVRVAEPLQFPNMLQFFTKIGFHNEATIEIINEQLYHNLSKYNVQTKINIINYMNILKFFPNKRFLLDLCSSVSTDIDSYPDKILYYSHAPNLLFSLSELERRYTKGLIYLEELDDLYIKIFRSIKHNFSKYEPSEIFRIASGRQRTGLYDEGLLGLIKEGCMKKEFFEFSEDGLDERLNKVRQEIAEIKTKLDNCNHDENDGKEYKALLLELRSSISIEKLLIKDIKSNFQHLDSLSGILHCFAVFNYRDENFIKYCCDIIELYYIKFLKNGETNLEFLNPRNLPKLMWSLCVLGEPHQIHKACRYVFSILTKTPGDYKMEMAEITQLYYCMLYLEGTLVFDMSNRDYLTEKYKDLTKGEIKTISMLHMELSKTLEKIEVGHSIEMSVKSIPVDIVLEQKTKEGKQIVIDFHGYNHFFRNNPELKGNAVFKKKVIEMMNCVYLEVKIFDWLLLDDKGKREYMKKFLEPFL